MQASRQALRGHSVGAMPCRGLFCDYTPPLPHLFLVIQINSRHNFLDRLLGATKLEEDISHARANEVNLWITLTTSLCCVLEIVIYFVYNRMVNNTN